MAAIYAATFILGTGNENAKKARMGPFIIPTGQTLNVDLSQSQAQGSGIDSAYSVEVNNLGAGNQILIAFPTSGQQISYGPFGAMESGIVIPILCPNPIIFSAKIIGANPAVTSVALYNRFDKYLPGNG